MPVTVDEIVKIRDVDGVEYEGKAVATNLVAIRLNEPNTYAYGMVTSGVKVHTRVECDNPSCVNSSVGEDFQTYSKVIEFDDNGDNSATFIKEISQIVITSDFQGNKKAFCTSECSANYFRHEAKKSNVVEFPAGKGKKTEFPASGNLQPLAQSAELIKGETE